MVRCVVHNVLFDVDAAGSRGMLPRGGCLVCVLLSCSCGSVWVSVQVASVGQCLAAVLVATRVPVLLSSGTTPFGTLCVVSSPQPASTAFGARGCNAPPAGTTHRGVRYMVCSSARSRRAPPLNRRAAPSLLRASPSSPRVASGPENISAAPHLSARCASRGP